MPFMIIIMMMIIVKTIIILTNLSVYRQNNTVMTAV